MLKLCLTGEDPSGRVGLQSHAVSIASDSGVQKRAFLAQKRSKARLLSAFRLSRLPFLVWFVELTDSRSTCTSLLQLAPPLDSTDV